MIRRPPPVTPFPYTTLFRSACKTARRPYHLPERLDSGGQHAAPVHRPGNSGRNRLLAVAAARRPPRGALGRPGDRKSTRLNSSHLVSSYAVFCLKEKNTGES